MKEKKKINKKLMIPLFVILALGLVCAGVYYVSTLNLVVGVNEAFIVKYAVLGDSSTYTEGTCAGLAVDDSQWFTAIDTNIPTGGFYPNEARRVCVRIQNLGEANIPYTITSRVTNDNEAKDCEKAFGNYDFTGTATALDYTYKGVTVQIAPDATPVQGCNVQIKVGRGTASV
jgi:hypothetical protein